MIRIATLGGTGDTYLICALAAAVREKHNTFVRIAVKARQSAIPEMFNLPWEPADEEIARAEADRGMQREYDNRVEAGRTFYAHPCFLRSGVRLDHLTLLHGSPSQADMYRELLGLPIDAPLTLPKIPAPPVRSNTVLLISNAVSWPNDRIAFWRDLLTALHGGGWSIMVNDPSSSLVDILALAAAAEMVIGPQCGFMSMIIAGQFPCRKVMATPSIEEGFGFPVGSRFLSKTFPYAYVTKFDGQDYDIEEYRITPDNRADIIADILAVPRVPRDPRPVTSIAMPLTPGDFLDRLAVLTVKRNRLGGPSRELNRYLEACPPSWTHWVSKLVDLHSLTFTLLETEVPIALSDLNRIDHKTAVFNQKRVELKHQIDAELRAPYTEIKSYHG